MEHENLVDAGVRYQAPKLAEKEIDPLVQISKRPQIGDLVVFFPNPDDTIGRSNGANVCPAIITRVWGHTGVCNLKIIPDHGPMQDRGSVAHKSQNPSNYSWCFKEEFIAGAELGRWPRSEY